MSDSVVPSGTASICTSLVVMTWLETPGTTLLAAQGEEGVLGVAVLVTRIMPKPGGGMHKVVEVDNLVVRADQRNRKIGRRLLPATVDGARDRKATHVEVGVHAFNSGALCCVSGAIHDSMGVPPTEEWIKPTGTPSAW